MADLNQEQLVDALSKLTIMDLSQLTKKLEEVWGVKAAPIAIAGVAAAGAAPAAAKEEEKDEFTVVLTSGGSNKIQVIKAIRELTSLGLKEAKELVDGAPKEIKAGVPKAEAEDIKKKIVEAGGTVEIK